jgi:hypothetical protein
MGAAYSQSIAESRVRYDPAVSRISFSQWPLMATFGLQATSGSSPQSAE